MEPVITLILIAVALSMDAFAVAVSSGVVSEKLTPAKILKLSFMFGFFQAAMPVLGWFLGENISSHIQAVDHWVVFAILAFIGIRMITEACNQEKKQKCVRSDPFAFKTLIIMAAATSIDALAVGVGFALEGRNIWISAPVIGVITFGLSIIGVMIGKKVGSMLQKRAEIIGGILLIGIGAKTLISHLFAI